MSNLVFDHVTTGNLNLRMQRRVARGTVITVLPKGTPVALVPNILIQDGDHHWRVALTRDGYVGWLDARFVAPVVTHAAPRSTFGLHYYPDNPDRTGVLRIAEDSALMGATVVNDYTFANELAARRVPYVVYRAGVTTSDPAPVLSGTTADIEVGYNWFFSAPYWTSNRLTDQSVILQLTNENLFSESLPFYDAYFYVGIIRAADEVKRRVVIFNDPVGTPHMWRDQAGNWQSPVWVKRTPALRACLYHADGRPRLESEQHFVGYHAYSAPGYGLASDEKDWIWYAGRWSALYETVPQFQPPLLLTEYGSFEADVMLMPHGIQSVITDVERSIALLRRYPVVKAFMYWTVGGGETGWAKSRIDAALPALREVARRALILSG